ncbi:MAG TPA: 2OG-Fe(II) oxygenase [Actinophytocola sp.]|jgi:hypothetical protein|uniref:2OG-Fe(II) oxygenase n=1 Tax=Actinophytocola sp. TaxID=1872138 RepID=UPI002F959B61
MNTLSVGSDAAEGNLQAARFEWDFENVAALLPTGWQQRLIDVAKNHSMKRTLVPPHSTSRESAEVTSLPIHCVGGKVVQHELPWLVDLYEGKFRKIGERIRGVRLTTARDPRYAVVLNVQFPGERYECHVDTNPVEALLYVTDLPKGTGGELAVANNVHARSKEEIDADCQALYPTQGELVFFDGRRHPHYVRKLEDAEIRVAVAMNYYTDEVPEETRPADLNEYLYGSQA